MNGTKDIISNGRPATTAQIGDIFRYRQKKYGIVAMSAPVLFDPKNYGMEPHASSTACRRGFWCEYDIREDGLYLQNLYLFNRDDNYPEFNGVSPEPPEYIQYVVNPGNNKNIKKKRRNIPTNFGHRLYKDVDLLIPYTGKILTGKDFLRDYCINMGFQQPFAYKTLIEFVFKEGLLTGVFDHSDVAKELRDKIDLDDPMWELGTLSIPEFVGNSFSLDYKNKAWWL